MTKLEAYEVLKEAIQKEWIWVDPEDRWTVEIEPNLSTEIDHHLLRQAVVFDGHAIDLDATIQHYLALDETFEAEDDPDVVSRQNLLAWERDPNQLKML